MTKALTNALRSTRIPDNFLLNGGMQVSQENGSTAGTTNGYYPVDQFFVGSSNGGAWSAAQVASVSPAGSPNRLRITVTAADAAVAAGDLLYISQRIEGLRVAELLLGSASAKTFTLQFGVKAPAGTYCIAFWNGASNRCYTTEYTISAAEANTAVVKSVTLTGDQIGSWATDTSIGLHIFWTLMAGSSLQTTANVWGAGTFIATANQFNFMGTNGNVFELFDVGLYEGTVAPSFTVPDYPSELLACQRYFWSYASVLSVAPITMSVGISSTTTLFGLNFSVVMRAAPAVAATGSGGYRLEGASAIAISSFAFSAATTQSVRGVATVSSGVNIGQAYQINTNAGGNFTANARM